MVRYVSVLLCIMSMGVSALAWGASIQQLEQRCEAAREERLAPEREAAIEQCIEKKEKEADKCRRYYEDYGAGGRTAAGGFRQRLYHDIPECQDFYEAEKNRAKR